MKEKTFESYYGTKLGIGRYERKGDNTGAFATVRQGTAKQAIYSTEEAHGIIRALIEAVGLPDGYEESTPTPMTHSEWITELPIGTRFKHVRYHAFQYVKVSPEKVYGSHAGQILGVNDFGGHVSDGIYELIHEES